MTLRSFHPLALVTLLAVLAPTLATSTAGAQGMGHDHHDDGPAVKALALGAAAPQATVEMENVDGKSVTLAKSAGKKGLLVLFICNHCPWVKAWQGRIATIGNGAAKQGIGVVAINANDPAAYPEDAYDAMVTRAKEVGYAFPYVVDATSGVAAAFGASHTPEAFLFDAKGKLVYHGAIDDNAHGESEVKSHWLADAVAAVAAGKSVPVAESKALGCGIKYRGKTAM